MASLKDGEALCDEWLRAKTHELILVINVCLVKTGGLFVSPSLGNSSKMYQPVDLLMVFPSVL